MGTHTNISCIAGSIGHILTHPAFFSENFFMRNRPNNQTKNSYIGPGHVCEQNRKSTQLSYRWFSIICQEHFSTQMYHALPFVTPAFPSYFGVSRCFSAVQRCWVYFGLPSCSIWLEINPLTFVAHDGICERPRGGPVITKRAWQRLFTSYWTEGVEVRCYETLSVYVRGRCTAKRKEDVENVRISCDPIYERVDLIHNTSDLSFWVKRVSTFL